MSDLLHLSVCELIDALESKATSATELMDETLDAIDATQGTLNAFTSMYDVDSLRDAARTADKRRARGEQRPLEGLPLGVKDLEDAAGLVTSKGSAAFRDNVAERDSIQVGRLRDAGAIVVGKTNSPEFGYTAITKNPLFGTTRNPWDLERTPGGSSGGSSAAIAGGVVALATASDGGGSIRIPASCVGCFGLKPSFGRVPEGPSAHWNIDQTSVWGPLTRTVEDAALQLDLTCGPDPLDPFSLPHPGISYREKLSDLPVGLRIGFAPDLGYAVVQSDIAAVVEDAARVFERLGHSLELVEGGPPEPGLDWSLLGALNHLSMLHPVIEERAEDFGRTYLRGIRAGTHMTPQRWGHYRERREQLNRWCADIFERYDLLLTPTIPFDPPDARGPFPEEVEGRKQPPASIGSFTMPFNLSWHPAATVRAGLSRAGMPVGLQIVASRHRDDLVLQAAAAFEAARPWHPQWPATPRSR